MSLWNVINPRNYCQCGNGIFNIEPNETLCRECRGLGIEYIPTEEEITEECKRIRNEWSPEMELNRRVGPHNKRQGFEIKHRTCHENHVTHGSSNYG